MSKERVIIIGFGASGKRFYKALACLKTTCPYLFDLVGVVDNDAKKLQVIEENIFQNLSEALAKTKPTAAVISVNEFAHFQVLETLSSSSVVKLMCEKPLTPTISESISIWKLIEKKWLNLNFVERYSPIISDFQKWCETIGEIRPLRVEFFWGKNRICDARPTIGVNSEICHPIDLCNFLLGISKWKINEAFTTSSDFSGYEKKLLDSIHFLASTDICPIIGHSSFVWGRRHRTIILHFTCKNAHLYTAVFDFDMPRWDCDQVKVEKIDSLKKSKKEVFLSSYTESNFPDNAKHISKIVKYLHKSLACKSNFPQFPECVNLSSALETMKIIEEIQSVAAQSDLFLQMNATPCLFIDEKLEVNSDNY